MLSAGDNFRVQAESSFISYLANSFSEFVGRDQKGFYAEETVTLPSRTIPAKGFLDPIEVPEATVTVTATGYTPEEARKRAEEKARALHSLNVRPLFFSRAFDPIFRVCASVEWTTNMGPFQKANRKTFCGERAIYDFARRSAETYVSGMLEAYGDRVRIVSQD